MDGERFDRLTKQLSTRRLTRLSVIRGLAVGAAAAFTGTTISTDRAMAQQCKREGQNCEGGPEKCCPGTVCNGGENPTKCRACGGSGQFCCVSTTPCTAPGETCLPGGICGPAPCGGTGEPCCETGDECTEPGDICLSNDTCGPAGQCGGTANPAARPGTSAPRQKTSVSPTTRAVRRGRAVGTASPAARGTSATSQDRSVSRTTRAARCPVWNVKPGKPPWNAAFAPSRGPAIGSKAAQQRGGTARDAVGSAASRRSDRETKPVCPPSSPVAMAEGHLQATHV